MLCMKYSDLQRRIKRNINQEPDFKPYRKVTRSDSRIIFAGIFLVLIALVWGVFFIVSENLKAQITNQIEDWVTWSHSRQFEITHLEHGEVQLTRFGFIVKQIRARGIQRQGFSYLPSQHFQVRIPLVQVYFRPSLSRGLKLGISFQGLDIWSGKILHVTEETGRRLDALSDVSFRAWIPLRGLPLNWPGQIIDWARQFKKWVFFGAHMPDVYLSGNASFIADGERMQVYFLSGKERNGETYLQGDPNDLRLIAQVIEPKFTEMDVVIASRNFLKTPQLLTIRTRAEDKAKAVFQSDSGISYDTYRHIFWSYFLAKNFDSEFAWKVTDAHETADSGNTEAESEKDRRNNALGIEYAQQGFSEREVEEMILTDPRIKENQAIL